MPSYQACTSIAVLGKEVAPYFEWKLVGIVVCQWSELRSFGSGQCSICLLESCEHVLIIIFLLLLEFRGSCVLDFPYLVLTPGL